MKTSSDSSQVEQLGGEQAEVLQYRSISTLAVVALLLGLLSIAAFAAPLLLIVPLAACCVAFAALVAIGRSADRLAGRRLAYAGLFLAIACGVGAVVRIEFRTRLLQDQASEAVEAWVDLLADRQWEAAVARLSGRGKGTLHPPTSPGEPPPPMAEVREHMTREMESTPLAERLADAQSPLQVRFVKPLSPPIYRGRNVTLQNLYEVRAAESDAEPFRMTVQLTRAPTFEEDGLSVRIDDWAVGQPPERP